MNATLNTKLNENLNTDTKTEVKTMQPTDQNTVQNTLANGYSLDSNRILQVFDLEFIDSFSSLLLSKEKYNSMCVSDRYNLIKRVMSMVDSSTNKGFLPSYDLNRFPIISELLPSFLLDGSESAVSEYISGCQSMESYKWLYNFLFLTLYLFCLETLENKSISTETEDLVADLKSLELEIYGRLEPSLRKQIQKRGLSIKANTYIGFDTEFTRKDSETNTLISTQLAVTTKTYVQIPKNTSYSLSTLDVKSNKVLKIVKSSKVLNYSKIETSLQMCIREVRKIKYGKIDESMLVLTECLRLIQGLSYDEKDDYIVFSLPRSVIQPYIHFGTSYSFKEIIDVSASISKPFLEATNKILMDLITSISDNKFSLIEGKDKLLEEIYKKYGGYQTIAELGKNSDKPLPLLPEVTLESNSEKRLSRVYLSEFSQRISVTKTKSYFIIAHLTPADLSLLSDFDDYKDDLSIVNGSFVTLGKPLIINGKNTHIRDTMLLAPGGNRALASIGRLYGEMFNKITISREDLEDMQGFLIRDREKFVEYALRDALISLIHASWMEDFNFKIGGFGIPLSLSAIGRRYVKNI